MTDRDYTAYCGLYCGDCIRYQSETSDLAKALLRQFEDRQYAEYAKVKQTQIPEFADFDSVIGILKAVSQLKCEIPCRLGGDGCRGGCRIIECVKSKSLEGCWQCTGYETCGELHFLIPFHGQGPLNNLRKIKEIGLEAWAKHREKFYPWSK